MQGLDAPTRPPGSCFLCCRQEAMARRPRGSGRFGLSKGTCGRSGLGAGTLLLLLCHRKETVASPPPPSLPFRTTDTLVLRGTRDGVWEAAPEPPGQQKQHKDGLPSRHPLGHR